MRVAVEHRGYTLRVSSARVDIYSGAKFITWALSLAQAKRLIDDMETLTKGLANG